MTPCGRGAVFAAVLLLGGPALPQESGSLREAQVMEILASLKDAPVARIWSRSDELVELGAPAKRILQKAIPDATIEGKLCALKALIDLESTTWAAEELLSLAADEKVALDHRLVALELIGLSEERIAEDGLLDLLYSLNPQVRVGSARALWRLGSPRSQRAKDVLRELLKSDDPELRAQGALALAEIGDADSPGLLEILAGLAREPGLRGQLAGALRSKLSLRKSLLRLEARGEEGSARRASGAWSHLDEIRARLQTLYDAEESLDEEKLRAAAARGLLTLPDDPHSAFMDPEEHAQWNEELDPSYGGIGALIDTNAKDFRIARPFFGGPAWKSDIRTGDAIVAVNGKPTEGRETNEIIKEIKGPPGTPVILTIYREGWSETKDVQVIRAKIVLPTVLSRMLPGDVGYLEIANYGEETGRQFAEELHALEGKGMKGLVIDLRWNPGGNLLTVKECLTPFLRAKELICKVKGRSVPEEPHVSGVPD
ncbi:MAG: S41 family peptidase, partial [Planctomycetota bacterium]